MELWILLPLVSSLLMASVNVVDKFFVLEGDDNLDYKDTSDTICHRHCAGGDCDDKEDDIR